jgi:rRNA maturation endonuclease Nob1
MRPDSDTKGEPVYECFGCGNRAENADTRVCDRCGSRMRNIGAGRDL